MALPDLDYRFTKRQPITSPVAQEFGTGDGSLAVLESPYKNTRKDGLDIPDGWQLGKGSVLKT